MYVICWRLNTRFSLEIVTSLLRSNTCLKIPKRWDFSDLWWYPGMEQFAWEWKCSDVKVGCSSFYSVNWILRFHSSSLRKWDSRGNTCCTSWYKINWRLHRVLKSFTTPQSFVFTKEITLRLELLSEWRVEEKLCFKNGRVNSKLRFC